MAVLAGIIQWRLLVDVHALRRAVAGVQQDLEEYKVARDADQVERVLLLLVLSLHVCIVLDEEVHHLGVGLPHSIMQGALPGLLLLVVNVDGHVSGEILIGEARHHVVIAALGGGDKLLALLKV